jgi:hypothetical protein
MLFLKKNDNYQSLEKNGNYPENVNIENLVTIQKNDIIREKW